MAAKKIPQIIFIDHRIWFSDSWVIEQLLNTMTGQLLGHEGLSAFVRPTGERSNDFTVTWFAWKPDPIALQLIGIPGKGKVAIIQTVFERV